MKDFASLLLPLDGSPEAARGARCALWLADALGATLHVLHASSRPLAGGNALARLHVPGASLPHVVLHQLPGEAEPALLDAISAYKVDMVVMSARGASASSGLNLTQRLGSVAQAVIERSLVPVLLLPLRYRLELPWKSMLVAASGEKAADAALEFATRLAAALRLRLTAVHAAENGPIASPALGTFADATHHEYAGRMEELMARGLAACTDVERGSVETARLRCGDPASVLLEQAGSLESGVLALGWHGMLNAGRALVLKRLLDEAECALLLVRAPEDAAAHLRVGKEIEE